MTEPSAATLSPEAHPSDKSIRRHSLFAACSAHAVHDGLTDVIYVLLPALLRHGGVFASHDPDGHLFLIKRSQTDTPRQ